MARRRDVRLLQALEQSVGGLAGEVSALAMTKTWPRASKGETWAVRSISRVASTEVEVLRSRSSTWKSGWKGASPLSPPDQTMRRQWRQTPQGRAAGAASQSRVRASVQRRRLARRGVAAVRGSPKGRAAPGGRTSSAAARFTPAAPPGPPAPRAHRAVGLVGGSRGGDDVEAPRLPPGQLQKAAPHPLVELQLLGVQPVGGAPLAARRRVAAAARRLAPAGRTAACGPAAARRSPARPPRRSRPSGTPRP